MTPSLLLLENAVVCLLILVALRRVQSMAVVALDNRQMYNIPFCRLLPVACGIVLAVLVLKALRISICFHLDTMPRKYLCPNPVVQSSSSRSLIAHCVPCFDWGI